jgi:hypothetical protein
VWGLALALLAGGLALVKQGESARKAKEKTPDQLREEGVKLGRKQAADEAKERRKADLKMQRLVDERVRSSRASRYAARPRPTRLDDDLDDDSTSDPGKVGDGGAATP